MALSRLSTTYDPFETMLGDIHRDLSSLMNWATPFGFSGIRPLSTTEALPSTSQIARFTPKLDVKESEKQLIVVAELPGIKKDDVSVQIRNGALELRGHKQEEQREESETYRRMERVYGEFFRRIPVPEGIDESQVKAKFQDGLLQIVVPLPEKHAGGQEITIE